MRITRRNPADEHLAQLEAVVARYAPVLWERAAAERLRWLRFVLLEITPRLQQHVFTRTAVDPSVTFVEGLIRNATLLKPTPDLTDTVKSLGRDAGLAYGFLPTDPRAHAIEDYTRRLLQGDVFSFWQTLTDPERLAKRITQLREQGTSVTGLYGALASEYRQGYYAAERLVRTAYNAASNYANLQDIQAQGYTHKRWLTARDSRVRPAGERGSTKSSSTARRRKPGITRMFNHRRMDGVTVPIDQPFLMISGARMMHPGDRSLGAPRGEIINCRCTVIGVMQDGTTRPMPLVPAPQPALHIPPPVPLTPAAANQPQGTPVSQALDVRIQPRAILGAPVHTALAEIDRVHGDGALPRIPLEAYRSQDSNGAYVYQSNTGKPLRINLSVYGNTPELTLVHEVGHFLDHQVIGTRGQFASSNHLLMREWRDAVEASQAVQTLRQQLRDRYVTGTYQGVPVRIPVEYGYVRYLLTPEELWARAYAQYVAQRSGNVRMLDQVRVGYEMRHPKQWETTDFQRIAEAIDNLFRTLGWRT